MKYLALGIAGVLAATPIKAESDGPFIAFSDPLEFGNRMIRQADSTGKAIRDIIVINGKADTVDYGNPNKKVFSTAVQPYKEECYPDPNNFNCSDNPEMKMINTQAPLKDEIIKIHFQNFQYFKDGNLSKLLKAYDSNAVSHDPNGNKKIEFDKKTRDELRSKAAPLRRKELEDILDASYVCTVDKTQDHYGFKFKKGDIMVTTLFKLGVDLPDSWAATYRKIDGKWKIVFEPRNLYK